MRMKSEISNWFVSKVKNEKVNKLNKIFLAI
jgi:hypothetical protein